VLLRAFGLPDRLGLDRSRIVIKMEEIIHSSEARANSRSLCGSVASIPPMTSVHGTGGMGTVGS